MKKAQPVFIAGLLALVLVFTGILTQPAEVKAASSNKVLKVTNLSFSNKKEASRFRGAEIRATQLKTDKLTKSTMKLSGKVYIPVKAFTKKSDEIMISPELVLTNSKDTDVGVIYCKYDVILKYTGSGVELYKQNGNYDNPKRSAIGSCATVKKSGNYYLVTLKNLPLTGDCLDAEDNLVSINTKKNYVLNPGFTIFSTTAKAWKGTVMVDDIQLKTASLTQKITFDKADYKGIFAKNWAFGDPKASVAKL